MQVKLLCIGDVVGGPGRRALQDGLPRLVSEHEVDFVIVNAENAAAGSGITPTIYEKIIGYGVDVITLGDHIYRRREIIPVLEKSDRLVRPANLPVCAPGKSYVVRRSKRNHAIAVVSLLGRMYMKTAVDCPFAAIDRVLGAIPADASIVVVDMHAEVTSEKVAMGWHLDGRVSLMFGTHTHVPTADERVLPKGTAYITDVGMTGPYDSVLGRSKDRVLSTMISAVPTPFDVATDDVRISGVVATIESSTGKATGIKRVVIQGAC